MQYPPVPLCAFRGIQCIVILKESGAYALSHKVSKNLLITQISKFDPL